MIRSTTRGFRTRITLMGLIALAPSGATAQASLTPDGRLPGSLQQISNVVEVGPDRVAFADTKARTFLIGDFAAGKVELVGRHVDTVTATSGPGEYKYPGWVARYAGGTVALVDFAALRATLWDAQGRPLKRLTLPAAGGATPVLAYDTLGHGYKIDYQAIMGGGEPGRALRPDSIPVLRIDIASGKIDTIARLGAPDYGDARFGDQVQQVAKIFSPNDYFGVLPDGTVWVARARANSVDWRDLRGQWTRGTARPFSPAPVTAADRERVMTRLKEHGLPTGVSASFPFATTKPPFESAASRPNGEVWLQRSRASENEPVTFDVLDRSGKPPREVHVPLGVTVVGFGGGNRIYALSKASPAGRTLERYRLQ